MAQTYLMTLLCGLVNFVNQEPKADSFLGIGLSNLQSNSETHSSLTDYFSNIIAIVILVIIGILISLGL